MEAPIREDCFLFCFLLLKLKLWKPVVLQTFLPCLVGHSSNDEIELIYFQKMAEAEGCQQCLWLIGDDHEITEVGAMNIFILMKNARSAHQHFLPFFMVVPDYSCLIQ